MRSCTSDAGSSTSAFCATESSASCSRVCTPAEGTHIRLCGTVWDDTSDVSRLLDRQSVRSEVSAPTATGHELRPFPARSRSVRLGKASGSSTSVARARAFERSTRRRRRGSPGKSRARAALSSLNPASSSTSSAINASCGGSERSCWRSILSTRSPLSRNTAGGSTVIRFAPRSRTRSVGGSGAARCTVAASRALSASDRSTSLGSGLGSVSGAAMAFLERSSVESVAATGRISAMGTSVRPRDESLRVLERWASARDRGFMFGPLRRSRQGSVAMNTPAQRLRRCKGPWPMVSEWESRAPENCAVNT